MIQLIVTVNVDDDFPVTAEEAREQIQRAIDSDLRCTPAQVDIPGGGV